MAFGLADGSQLGPWASQEELGMIGEITAFTAIQRRARPEPRLRNAAAGCLREEICWGAGHGVLVWVLVGTRWMLERFGESDLFSVTRFSLGTKPSRDCFPRRAQSDDETSTIGLITSQTQNRIIREVIATAKKSSSLIAVSQRGKVGDRVLLDEPRALRRGGFGQGGYRAISGCRPLLGAR